MNVMHRQKIGAAFSAADQYGRYARVQRIVARRLAERIAALPLPPCPRILEIGCGTGFLTEAIIAQGISADWIITDISSEMVERCRERVGNAPDRQFAMLDGEYGVPDDVGSYDLICSSLAVQWFDDLEPALGRILDWLSPGGHSAFTTLAPPTFGEWREAHALAGLQPGTPDFPSVSELAAMHSDRAVAPPEISRYVERHDDALDFMRCLKAIGAQTARKAHRPLPPAQLRQVMRHFEEAGAEITYEVVTCVHAKPAPDQP